MGAEKALQNNSKLGNRWQIIDINQRAPFRYFVENEPIFEGVRAVIYRAFDAHLEKTVAVKILSIGHTDEDETSLKREAFKMARISGKLGVPIIYDYFVSKDTPEGKTPVMVMDYIEEESLNDALNNKTLTPEDSIRVITQTAELIDSLASDSVFHGDLKPEHIKLSRPFIILVDFGADGKETDFTFGFSAPERFKGIINQQTEEFSLAAIAYNITTGKTVTELGTDPMTIKTKFKKLSKWNLKFDFDESDIIRLNEIFDKALSNNPEGRYKSASEFAKEFAEVMGKAQAKKVSILSTLSDALNF